MWERHRDMTRPTVGAGRDAPIDRVLKLSHYLLVRRFARTVLSGPGGPVASQGETDDGGHRRLERHGAWVRRARREWRTWSTCSWSPRIATRSGWRGRCSISPRSRRGRMSSHSRSTWGTVTTLAASLLGHRSWARSAVAHAAGVSPTMGGWREMSGHRPRRHGAARRCVPTARHPGHGHCVLRVGGPAAGDGRCRCPCRRRARRPTRRRVHRGHSRGGRARDRGPGNGVHVGEAGGASAGPTRGRRIRPARRQDLLGDPGDHRYPHGETGSGGPPDQRDAGSLSPLGREGKAEEVAAAVAFLLGTRRAS